MWVTKHLLTHTLKSKHYPVLLSIFDITLVICVRLVHNQFLRLVPLFFLVWLLAMHLSFFVHLLHYITIID